jgi:acetoin utilization deacetylase AcuC-like enzyme
MPTPPIVYSSGYAFAWPGHVFPTGKYRAVAEALLAGGDVEGFALPATATREELLTCHLADYLDRLSAIASGVVPWDPRFECPVNRAVLDAFLLSTGGTIAACRLALRHGLAANIGGGFHHAYPDHGEGFCLLNDVIVAARVLIREGAVSRVLVVDLDVHQGNGTAVAADGDPAIFTLSVHQEDNYPPKERSDLDVGLPDLTGDEAYLEALAGALREVTTRFLPELVIYLAGADPYTEDRLGGLTLTLSGLAARDRLVFDFAREHGAKVTAVLAGGYAIREEDVVSIHVRMLRELLSRINGTG